MHQYTLWTDETKNKKEALAIIVLEPRLDQHPSFDFVVCIPDSVWHGAIALFLSAITIWHALANIESQSEAFSLSLSLSWLFLRRCFSILPVYSRVLDLLFCFVHHRESLVIKPRNKREKRETEGILPRQQLNLVARSRLVGPVGTGRPPWPSCRVPAFNNML